MSREVDNLAKYREPELQNDQQQPLKRFSEHIVLLTIIVLSVLNGITTPMSNEKVHASESLGQQSFGLYYSLGSLAGAIMLAFLSDVCGRKPIFIVLAAISTITSTTLLSSSPTITVIGFSIHSFYRGGAATVFYLTVTEYCSPKHRFTYIIASVAAMFIVGPTVHNIWTYYDLPGTPLQVVMIVLGLLCLGSACAWPESPYWLAARGRRGDAACALRQLRGAGAEPELGQLQHDRRSPGPVRLYWRSLLMVLIVSTIFHLRLVLDIAKFIYFDPRHGSTIDPHKVYLITSGAEIVGLVLMAIVSYFIKRKILYVSCYGVAIALIYVTGFCILGGSTINNRAFVMVILISDGIQMCALNCLSVILFTEIVPYKYNTHISLVRFIYLTLIPYLQMFIFITDLSNYVYILVLLIATLSLVGLILLFWLAPETKDRTLFEIQKSQAPQYTVTSPEQNETMMESIRR